MLTLINRSNFSHLLYISFIWRCERICEAKQELLQVIRGFSASIRDTCGS